MSDSQFVPLETLLAGVKGGGTPKRDVADYWTGTIPWATVKDFRDDVHILPRTQEHISEAGLKSSASQLIPPHTPIICTRMAVGRVAMADFAVAINQDLKALFPKPGIDASYLLRALESVKPEIEAVSIGSTVKGISLDQLRSLKVFLPESEQEQKKIAEVLSTLDRTIEQTEALIAKQQRIKTGLMQDLLTKGIDEHGNIRSEATHAFKDSPLGRIPMEWTCLEIQALLRNGDLLLVQDGNHGEAYPRSSAFALDGMPFISAKHIDKFGRIDFNAAPKLPNEYLGKLRIGFGASGDVVFAHNATVGPVGYVEAADPSYIASTSTTIYRSNESTLFGKYVFCFLMSEHFQLQIANIMGQTTRNQVPITAQKNLFFLLPKADEQIAITEKIASVISELVSTETNLVKLGRLKDGLMHDLLTGNRRVTPLLEQAAPQ